MKNFEALFFRGPLIHQLATESTESKFAYHTHKGVKRSWGVPIYSKTSCLKRLDLDLEEKFFEVEFSDGLTGKQNI